MHSPIAGFAELPPPRSGPDHFLAALRNANWPAFEPPRDLLPLRAALAELEQRYGVTDAHRFATEQIKLGGAVLRHPDGHLVEIDALALSPCARYLAVGSWCGDDYDRGGVLQIWELATGRCVNKLDRIMGGVGWPWYARCIQWSPDSRRVACAFNTNQIGVWDPFGENGNEPIARADVTDGYSRPPAFAFAPDGTQAIIQRWAPHEMRGCVVPLVKGAFEYYGGEPDEDSPQPGRPARTLPPAIRQRLGDDELSFEQVFWSRDGSRIYGYGGPGWAASIDVPSGQVGWLDDAELRQLQAPVWSLDERLVALQLNDLMLIADARTGALVARFPAENGPKHLSWGNRGRLAVVTSERPDGVVVHDRDGRSRQLHVTPKKRDWGLPDVAPWAWSPDGTHAACLTAADRIEIWSLGERPQPVAGFDVPEATVGVLWGAHDVLVAVGPTTLRFIQATTGEVLGDFQFLREPYSRRPLELGGDDVGEELQRRGHGDPSFVLDDDTWAAAFAPGLVIAPAGRRSDLDSLLAWVVDRRAAWPTRWGELEVVPSAAVAAGRLGPPYDEHLEPFAGVTVPAPTAAATWPPPNTATVEDLFQLALVSGRILVEAWDREVEANLRHAARLRARRGEPAGALDLLAAIPDLTGKLCGTAEVALILAAAGRLDEARSVFTITDADIQAALDDYPDGYNVPFVASAVGGAYAALGDAARADAWFARAVAAIEPERNPCERRLRVVWALIESGRVDQARAVLQGATTTPSSYFTNPFLVYLALTRRDELAREVLALKSMSPERFAYTDGEMVPLGSNPEGWFDGWESLEVLTVLGRPDLIRARARRPDDDDAYEEALADAEANARRGSRPTPADISALVEEYGTLLKTPRASREYPTRQLVRQAAECGHLSAALNLITAMPEDDIQERASSAFSALWIATTGYDAPPW